jgi:hypothetical protein
MYSLYSRHVSARIRHHQVNSQNIKKKYYSYNGSVVNSPDDGQYEPKHVVNIVQRIHNKIRTLSIVEKEVIIYGLILRATGCITL